MLSIELYINRDLVSEECVNRKYKPPLFSLALLYIRRIRVTEMLPVQKRTLEYYASFRSSELVIFLAISFCD